MSGKLCQAVLVVEDDDDIREALYDILVSEGYSVQAVREGKAALLALEGMPVPSLILLDLMMPGMNGWEFLDAQKRNSKFADHKVVTISALRPTQSIEDPTPLDIEGALAKPLSLESILKEVHKFCRGEKKTSSGSEPKDHPALSAV